MPHSHGSTACKNSETFKEPQAKMASSMQEEHFSCRWRGLRWRVMLGVLPPCPAPIEDLRCAVANGRRRYAELRRCLLVDPHVLEEIQKPNHLSVDNPLSQDPESAWGKYFQSAEVERIIDKDLTRLYPEHETFFQSPVCQAMLRRILLVWSLIHPHYSYRQGMHELLAPFLYVLHNDTRYLSELKQKYDDLFGDKFDDLVMQGLDLFENDGIRKGTFSFMRKDSLVPEGSRINSSTGWRERIAPQDFILLEPDEFGFDLRAMVLGNDTYGAEGELGCLLSQRFVEHDAYCMFDALMSGQGGHVAMAEYFTNVTAAGSAAGLSPVLEASTAVYQALAAVDSSLYLHLVELGIEPQFFALRWLCLLFGREFVIDKLLLLWDVIFAAPNATRLSVDDDGIVQSRYSHRSTFISAVAVTMLLCLRPSLLATQDDTSCLQRLLNFPGTLDIRGLINNAKLLQPVAEETVKTPSQWKFSPKFNQTKSIKFISKRNVCSQGHNKLQPQISYSPEFLKYSLPDSYWEEKWKNSVMQKFFANELAGQENMQLSNKGLHNKSPSHDSTVLITGAACREKRQPLSVEGAMQGIHTCAAGSNTVVECKINCGTTEEGHSHLERFVVNSTVLSEADCQKQDIKDINTREASREDHLPLFHGKAVVAASDPAACDHTNEFHEEEDGFTSTSPFSQDGTSVEYDAQSSTSSVTSEDCNSPPLRKSRSSVASSHTSKLLWLWNLGKRQSSDKAHIQKKDRAVNSESPISAKASQNLVVVNNSRVHSGVKARNKIHACNDVTSDLLSEEADESSATSPQLPVRNTSEFSSDGSNVSLMPKKEELLSKPQIDAKKGLCDLISDLTGASQIPKQKISTVLQILGQSILDNIQVLETALSQKTSVSSKEGLLGHTSINKEKPEHSMTTSVIGKGPVAAMAALAELRKISNLLLEL